MSKVANVRQHETASILVFASFSMSIVFAQQRMMSDSNESTKFAETWLHRPPVSIATRDIAHTSTACDISTLYLASLSEPCFLNTSVCTPASLDTLSLYDQIARMSPRGNEEHSLMPSVPLHHKSRHLSHQTTIHYSLFTPCPSRWWAAVSREERDRECSNIEEENQLVRATLSWCHTS